MPITMKMAWAMFKRKILQNILTGIIMLLMAVMLYIGLSAAGQSSPYDTMFERANASHGLYILSTQINDIEKSKAFFEEKTGVSGVLSQKVHMTNIDYMMKGKTETETVFLAEFKPNAEIDILYVTDQQGAEVPSENEILVNYNFAKARDLKKGDIITLHYEDKSFSFVIKDFVVDPQFSNAFITPNRCFLAPDFFEMNDIDYNSAILSVKYNPYHKELEEEVHKEYLKWIWEETPPIYLSHETIKMSYNVITSIISSVLLAVSFFIFLIVIFVIRGTIRNMMLQQYKSIGVKKVIGYTNGQIQGSFLWIYLWLGFITAVVGVLIGIPIRNRINYGISYDIQVGLSAGLDVFALISIVSIILLIYVVTVLAARQVNQIKPIQSIKYGMPENKLSHNRFNISRYKQIPLSLLLAIKQILMNKKKSFTAILTMVILIYVAFLINNMGKTLGDGEHFTKYLLGMQIGDFTITSSLKEKVQDTIDKVEAVENISNAVFIINTTNESTKDLNDEKVTIGGQIFYGNVPEGILTLTAGRQPKNSQEIVITNKLKEEIGKTVGDFMVIYNGTDEEQFLVCGLYNSVSYSSLGYVRFSKAIPETIQQENGYYWVYSDQKHVIIEEIELKMKSALSDAISVSKYDSNVKNILSTLEMFPGMILLLQIIFVTISGIVILNWTMMDILNMTRVFGILKASGFSNKMILKILLVKTLLLTGIGLFLGFGLCLVTMNPVMLGVFKVTPFNTIELPVLFDAEGSLILMGMFLLISLIATALPGRKLNNISPKQLIAE